MKNKKNHLSKEERFFIEKTLKTDKSFSYIAKLLDRGVSTISIEVNKNGGKDNYNSTKAEIGAQERQAGKKSHLNKLIVSKLIRNFAAKRLIAGESPEVISKEMKQSKNFYASPKSIRKYLQQNKP